MENQKVNEIYAQSIALPSRGVLYPKDHPLFQKTEIEIMPMTTYGEDILTSKQLIKKKKVIDELIKSCLVNKDIDPGTLYTFDRNAIFIAIRSLSYGPEYSTTITCNNELCNQKFNHIFNLSTLDIKTLDEKLIFDDKFEFSFTLPKSKKNIKFKFFTGDEEREFAQIIESTAITMKKNNIYNEIENQISTKWIQQITEFDGKTKKDEIAMMVRNMLAYDSSALRNYIDKITPGIITVFNIECPHCENTMELEMPIDREFFWPK